MWGQLDVRGGVVGDERDSRWKERRGGGKQRTGGRKKRLRMREKERERETERKKKRRKGGEWIGTERLVYVYMADT